MKKKWVSILAVAVFALGLAACGKADTSKSSTSDKKEVTLKVGASPTPHAEILEHVKPILKKEGVNLKIIKFDDYILPNKALESGEIDANYFQHIPYLNQQIKENGYDFVNAGSIHVEPMALYSQTVKDLKDLKTGATIITSNSESDWGRIITILQDADLVKVKEGVDLETATFDDITENPKKLKFEHTIDPSLLATAYQNDEGDVVAINANYAVGIGLNPQKDSLAIEKDNSPYANVIAVRSEDKNNAAVKKLVKVLHSKDVQAWITKEFKGVVKPVDK